MTPFLLPWNKSFFDIGNDRIHQSGKKGQNQNRQQHELHLKSLAMVNDKKTKTFLCYKEFTYDDTNKRQPNIDFQSIQDIWDI